MINDNIIYYHLEYSFIIYYHLESSFIIYRHLACKLSTVPIAPEEKQSYLQNYHFSQAQASFYLN